MGEQEAAQRLATYIARICKNPDIEYISIKISTLYSQINSSWLCRCHSVYSPQRAALHPLPGRARALSSFARMGKRAPKFVNLDMEEYRDLAITYQAFVRNP